jgi:hypothetical protein
VAAFLTAMRARELWMGIGAEQVLDTAANEETIATASVGTELPAVVLFREGGYGPASCALCVSIALHV